MGYPNIEDVISFVSIKHNLQTDKAGVPYINHLHYVASKCKSVETVIVAYCHDLLEDTSTSIEELEILLNYNFDLLEAIICITKLSTETYFEYISRVNKNSLAKQVKIEDLLHNLSDNRGIDISFSLKGRYEKALNILNEKRHP